MPSSNIALIFPLVDAQRSLKTGSKAANLSKLITANFPVPKGFVISADAYRSHLWASGARERASAAAEAEDREMIREAILSSQIPEDVWSTVADAYKRLSWKIGFENPKVAVRSSAIEGSQDGFTGAYESFLNVSGLDALNVAVKRVWASLWNGKAAAYRAKYQIDSEPAMAIIIQEMLDADWFGTALTADPVTGNPQNVLISCDSIANAGESNAAAMNLPQYKVDLRDFSSTDCGEITDSPGDDIISLIAEKSVLIEDIISSKADVEWAYEGDKLWFLQARPIAELPVYFPNEANDSDKWQRISPHPISYFSRSCFWKSLSDKNKLINGFVYRRAVDMSEYNLRNSGKDCAAGNRLLTQWHKGIEPNLRSSASAIIKSDLPKIEYVELMSSLADAAETARIAADWLETSRHYSTLFPHLLKQLLQETDKSSSLYQKLLCGLPSPTIMRDAKLQELGEKFAIADGQGRTGDRKWWLGYKKSVDEFAREYGYSFKNAGEMCDVALWESWIEDSDSVFRAIGALARRDKRPSLLTQHCASEQAAIIAACDTEAHFKGKQHTHFKTVLELSRQWLSAANEIEHVYALACTSLRLVLMELGDRFCDSHLISEIDDIFFLTFDEIAALPAQPNETHRAIVSADIACRRHNLWMEQRLIAPDILTSDMESTDNAVQNSNDVLFGRAVCPGLAAGRVRIAKSIAEAGEIENGDLLIVDSPGLAWTPFLALAGGFISERDSLGEAGIIREYGIPAVVNCRGIMASVRDGQRITIDGSNGMIDLKKAYIDEPVSNAMP